MREIAALPPNHLHVYFRTGSSCCSPHGVHCLLYQKRISRYYKTKINLQKKKKNQLKSMKKHTHMKMLTDSLFMETITNVIVL